MYVRMDSHLGLLIASVRGLPNPELACCSALEPDEARTEATHQGRFHEQPDAWSAPRRPRPQLVEPFSREPGSFQRCGPGVVMFLLQQQGLKSCTVLYSDWETWTQMGDAGTEVK